jgi:glycosyltransferase involved in cell wall biosynthesis
MDQTVRAERVDDSNAGPEPSLSVILCVNRSNPWLSEAIQSVLAQDDPDFEFLIAANACSDDLWGQLCKVAALDGRVKLFRSAIGQLAFNLNLLADQAQGDYLVRMDADDVCEPHRLRILRQSLAENPVDILGSAASLVDGEGNVIGLMTFPERGDEIAQALMSRTAFCHPTVALRRQLLLDLRGYLGGFMSEDTDLWLRARRGHARMRNLSEPLLRYRVHSQQSIASRAGYAEVAAHWLRELLQNPSWYSTRGFLFALTKALFVPVLPGIRRYRQKNK